MNNDELYLTDILTAIAKIQSYTGSSRDSFFESPMVQADYV